MKATPFSIIGPCWSRKMKFPNKVRIENIYQARLMHTNTKPDDACVASRVQPRFMQSKLALRKHHRCPTSRKVKLLSKWPRHKSAVDKFLGVGGSMIQFRHAFTFLHFCFEPRFCHKCLHRVCKVPNCHDNQKGPTGNYL